MTKVTLSFAILSLIAFSASLRRTTTLPTPNYMVLATTVIAKVLLMAIRHLDKAVPPGIPRLRRPIRLPQMLMPM